MSPEPHEPDQSHPTPDQSHPTPDLTPTDEQVRRLLADARHTTPMPADVVARLDGVLADLAAEGEPDRTLERSALRATDLATARRRRTARNFLIAAAAVVAIGVGINQADLTITAGDADGGSSSVAGDADAAGGAEGREPSTTTERDSRPEDDAPHAEAPGAGTLDYGYEGEYAREAVRLSADRFGTQVRRLQRSPRVIATQDRATSENAAKADGLFSLGSALRRGCSTRGWGAGLLVPVRYDGALGGLVFREAHGETQVVDLFLCDNDAPVRSITLPAR